MDFKPYFSLNRQEKSGVFFLLLIIVVLQVILFLMKGSSTKGNFSVDKEAQIEIDSLKKVAGRKSSTAIYPFNPNYITDYKGYTLGMSPEQIDRLLTYRKSNLFVNSAEEFQQVTKVSDSLLKSMSPYFKFPDWVNKNNLKEGSVPTPNSITAKRKVYDYGETTKIKDLNSVTVEELKSIYGIGEKLSQRIVKFRNRLGGFMVNEQLYDVYGLESEVVERTLLRFQVLKKPDFEKININTASAKKLMELVYIKRNVANGIIDYRNVNGSIVSFDELMNIENFPKDKIDRIKLYLTL